MFLVPLIIAVNDAVFLRFIRLCVVSTYALLPSAIARRRGAKNKIISDANSRNVV